jgi:iron complex outermembrane receptor protein
MRSTPLASILRRWRAQHSPQQPGRHDGRRGRCLYSEQPGQSRVGGLADQSGWQVTPNVLLYASASHGEKSGAANTSATASQAALVITRPEKSTDFEGGIKTTWAGGKATLNLNLYNNTITDYQSSRVDSTNASFGTYLANVGKVRLRGFELEATYRPVPAFGINANLAYNDAKYLDYADAPAPLEYQAALGGAAKPLSLTGYQVIGSNKWTVQGGVDLDQPIGGEWNLTGFANTS